MYKSQYQTSPEPVSSENKLQEVQNKYSDKTESSDNSVTQSLNTKINSYATESNSSSSLDMSKYDPVDFSSQYQSTFNEAAAGGVGISKLQQPGVNGTNISVNYASSGTATLTRDSNGGIVSEATGDAATAHTMNNNQVLTVLQAFDFIRIGVISSIEIQRVGDGFVIYLIGAEQNWAIRSQRNDQPRIFKSLQAAVNIIDDLGVPTEIIKIPIIRG